MSTTPNFRTSALDFEAFRTQWIELSRLVNGYAARKRSDPPTLIGEAKNYLASAQTIASVNPMVGATFGSDFTLVEQQAAQAILELMDLSARYGMDIGGAVEAEIAHRMGRPVPGKRF